MARLMLGIAQDLYARLASIEPRRAVVYAAAPDPREDYGLATEGFAEPLEASRVTRPRSLRGLGVDVHYPTNASRAESYSARAASTSA